MRVVSAYSATLGKTQNYSKGHQTTPASICTEAAKLLIKNTEEVVRCCLYGGKS